MAGQHDNEHLGLGNTLVEDPLDQAVTWLQLPLVEPGLDPRAAERFGEPDDKPFLGLAGVANEHLWRHGSSAP